MYISIGIGQKKLKNIGILEKIQYRASLLCSCTSASLKITEAHVVNNKALVVKKAFDPSECNFLVVLNVFFPVVSSPDLSCQSDP